MSDGAPPADLLFRALADPTRRAVLDRLRVRDGQSLGDLCEGVGMRRQSLTQHVDVLVDAGLLTVTRRGRLRLHNLNPEPIHRLSTRWIAAFDRPRLDALAAIRRSAEEASVTDHTTDRPVPAYVYVTYVRATPEQVWEALTDADLTARYWVHRNESDWRVGSQWRHQSLDDEPRTDCTGRVLESDPPRRLVVTWESPDEFPGTDPSRVTFTLEPGDGITRLRVEHENLADRTALDQITHGWSAVLSNLKSLLETGESLPQHPWTMTPV